MWGLRAVTSEFLAVFVLAQEPVTVVGEPDDVNVVPHRLGPESEPDAVGDVPQRGPAEVPLHRLPHCLGRWPGGIVAPRWWAGRSDEPARFFCQPRPGRARGLPHALSEPSAISEVLEIVGHFRERDQIGHVTPWGDASEKFTRDHDERFGVLDVTELGTPASALPCWIARNRGLASRLTPSAARPKQVTRPSALPQTRRAPRLRRGETLCRS